ncbi:MAG: leucyl aminopeptidase [Candidatus Nanopelagicales bacterium]
MTTLSLTSADLAGTATDAVVVAIAPAGDRRRKSAVVVGPAARLKAVPAKRLQESLAALGATGKAGEVHRVPGSGITAAALVLAVGLGEAGSGYDEESLRRAAGTAARALAGRRRAVFALPVDGPAQLEAVALGVALGAYSFTAFRADSMTGRPVELRSVALLVPDAKDADSKAALSRAQVIGAAVNLSRDLINTPSSAMTPSDLAAAATSAAEGLPLDVEILDEAALRAGGYGGIIGVGQGSANPPRLIRLAYRPEEARAHLALVGKGITFDTGGISIKPSLNMHLMKTDMSGAAAVIAATTAIARLGIPVSVTGYAASAENMPGGAAQRPGDVITIYGGKTVEVLDTDAEGRLVLADALVRAQEDSPDVIVDVATLTGAQVVALGSRTAGIMANDDDLRGAVHAAATRAGETTWPMPQPTELRSRLDSLVADIANIPTTGRREAGMLTASVFLREFVKDSQRWAHLDIAGPAYNEHAAYGYVPTGGTGVAVRTFIQLAEDLADGSV